GGGHPLLGTGPLEVLLALPPDSGRPIRSPRKRSRALRRRQVRDHSIARELSDRGPAGRRLRPGNAGHLPGRRPEHLDPDAAKRDSGELALRLTRPNRSLDLGRVAGNETGQALVAVLRDEHGVLDTDPDVPPL